MLAMDTFLGQDSLSFFRNWLNTQSYSQIFVLVDNNTAQYCYPHLQTALPEQHHLIQIQAGEEHKNINTCIEIWQQLTDKQADRKSLLINLGGGVIGDMGGFCAATYKRGIDFVQVPTTLLAQVDASIGGKVGIDFEAYKNQIGIFIAPVYTLIEPIFLQTLPKAELYAGLAEAIKHCLIADSTQFELMQSYNHNFEPHLENIVAHSIQVKMRIVKADFKEENIRKTLNFGHTIGHALESYLLNQPKRKILHGEAIIVGMIAEAWIAQKKERLPAVQYQNIVDYLMLMYPKKVEFSIEEIPNIAQLCWQDKKNTQGKILLSTLKSIGEAVFDIPTTQGEIEAALYAYQGIYTQNKLVL